MRVMNRVDLSEPATRVLPRILQKQADEAGDTAFLVRGDSRFTFREADVFTDRLAAGLAGLGVGRGDRVGIYLSGRPEAVLVALAVNKLGAVWVPINNDYKGEWLADTVVRSRTKVLFVEPSLVSRLEDIRDQLTDEIIVLLDEDREGFRSLHEVLLENAPRSDLREHDYGDTCSILWTSGTTGRSKAVLQSHNNWLRPVHVGVLPKYDLQDGDVIYNVLPLFNSGAWVTSVFPALAGGVTCVLDGPFSVTHFWDRVRSYGATHTFTLGAMHMFLWGAPEKPDDADNPLRVAMMVPIPADLQEPFEKRFGFKLSDPGYGQSECMLITGVTDRSAPPGSLGYTMSDTDIRLFDDEDREVPVGEVGEVRIRPLEPHIVFQGYFEDEEATLEAYRGPHSEWYCTGDMAKLDENGVFWFVDRKKDAIRFGGRNISTMQVEGVVRRHPAVANVAAFGIQSKEIASEHELKVDVILAEGANLTPEELASFINDTAPHYFVPRYIEFVDDIPMTPTSKVQKYLLREKGVGPATWDRVVAGYVVRR